MHNYNWKYLSQVKKMFKSFDFVILCHIALCTKQDKAKSPYIFLQLWQKPWHMQRGRGDLILHTNLQKNKNKGGGRKGQNIFMWNWQERERTMTNLRRHSYSTLINCQKKGPFHGQKGILLQDMYAESFKLTVNE